MKIVTSLAFTLGISGIAACGGSGSSGGNDGGGDASTGGDAASGASCAPGAGCTAADKSCIGLVDNSGSTKFGLRMSQITFAHPASFTAGLIGTTLAAAPTPDVASCNLLGQGTFSWLLQFDTAAGTLTTGGAKPVADPTTGYTFDSETLSGFMAQPASMSTTPDASGHFTVTTGVALNLPIFLDAQGANALVVPIQQARISMGTLSSSHNCIGSYNAAGLDPANSCQADTSTPTFINGGSFDGFIKLTDADEVQFPQLAESLCVLLSGDASTYGDGASPEAHCKLGASNGIAFQGDWCSTTNAAATASCADAVQLSGQFAASSVKID